ncbi:alba DNA/RNA-binding protein isoform X2 [Wolffia australiana]
MDRYQRVEKPRTESAIKENEIRITTQGMIRNYITYATSLFQDRQMKEIVLKAMGQAISKAVAVAEVIKRNRGLHQDTKISSTSIIDVWEPIEEGLVPLEMTRHVSVISITLSVIELDKNSPGYQAPTHVENNKPHSQHYPRQQWQQQQPPQVREPQGPVPQESNGQARGRGRGRGWGRGGYGYRGGYERGYAGRYGGGGGGGYGGGGYGGGYRGEYDEGYGGGYGGYHNDNRGPENGGWNHEGGRDRGRGRGWGYQGGGGYERGRGGNGRGRGRIGGRGRTGQS